MTSVTRRTCYCCVPSERLRKFSCAALRPDCRVRVEIAATRLRKAVVSVFCQNVWYSERIPKPEVLIYRAREVANFVFFTISVANRLPRHESFGKVNVVDDVISQITNKIRDTYRMSYEKTLAFGIRGTMVRMVTYPCG